MENKKEKREVGFLGSLSLLVCALAAFVFLLVFFAPDDKQIEISETNTAVVDPSPVVKREPQKQRLLSRAEMEARLESESASAPPSAVNVETEEEPKTGDNADIEVLLTEAIKLIDDGEPERAKALVDQILEKDPNNERALVECALLHLIDFRSPQDAMPCMEKSLQVNPSNRIMLGEYVATCSEIDSVDACIDNLRTLQENASAEDASYASVGIAHMLMEKGREDEALIHMERAAENSPSNPDILGGLADTYDSRGFPDKATDTYWKAVAAGRAKVEQKKEQGKPHKRETQMVVRHYIEIVRGKVNEGDYDGAMKVIQEARSFAPDNHSITSWTNRVLTAKQRG